MQSAASQSLAMIVDVQKVGPALNFGLLREVGLLLRECDRLKVKDLRPNVENFCKGLACSLILARHSYGECELSYRETGDRYPLPPRERPLNDTFRRCRTARLG
ncbi:hypothetical protein TNCV_1223281 [Trichonephila clavipes]|nr:hypothetical protein TNCV_1223281 [Trichonephila clavipes]